MTVRVRYAPSPTGHLHIGGARTALFNYLLARKAGGTYILRIEDTDQSRNVEHADEKFLENFKWLGLHWDEGPGVGGEYGPYSCMERLPVYNEYVNQLLEQGKAYYCYCTEEELEKEREEAMAQGQMPRYSGRCRSLTPDQKSAYEKEGRKKTIRFRVPDGKIIKFTDLVRGDMHFESDGIGDYVIVKSDGIPTYNFAVTIDDHLMKISHVIRGEEHLSNTPRQILIYDAFGWDKPQFAHVSLILNRDGKKLSKRDESIIQFIEQYRNLGYLPEAILNYLALLGWSPGGEQEIFSLEELVQAFSLDRVSKSGAIFDTEKLAWMNSHYIKQADLQRIVELAIPHLQQAGYIGETFDHSWVTKLVALHKEKMSYVAELPELAKQFFEDDLVYAGEAAEILQEEQVPVVVAAFLEKAKQMPEWTAGSIQLALKEIQKETGYKGRALFMTVRVAATGQVHGPDLNQSLELLGRERVITRLQNILVKS
ncbi:glutamate--tRNA ligase [Effusibacillus lacus]|uniref:Glutamate--tRNA ligase n=1 Tax=Effusibacillus lacus TaxID=1348429 RepID=A0A292YLH8_9BACL|nr:glutamate--tRNA ligase [Effusibacillus lacus]TCS69150.1 glutamyl-tRNA synthetase /glutamate--tRNA(Gln) ligase [Effusibacillus lacus]GAX89345.1 glutamate--tRNA ligase [Effusibacillus lacus]